MADLDVTIKPQHVAGDSVAPCVMRFGADGHFVVGSGHAAEHITPSCSDHGLVASAAIDAWQPPAALPVPPSVLAYHDAGHRQTFLTDPLRRTPLRFTTNGTLSSATLHVPLASLEDIHERGPIATGAAPGPSADGGGGADGSQQGACHKLRFASDGTSLPSSALPPSAPLPPPPLPPPLLPSPSLPPASLPPVAHTGGWAETHAHGVAMVDAPATGAEHFFAKEIMHRRQEIVHSSAEMTQLPRPWRAGLGVDLEAIEARDRQGHRATADPPEDSRTRTPSSTTACFSRRQEQELARRVSLGDGRLRPAPRPMRGPGDAFSAARTYTDASALSTVLGAGYGSTVRSGAGWTAAPVRLVRAEYLIELAASGTPLPARQEAPEAAFFNSPPDRARIVALACPWLADEHPDRDSFHLSTIAPRLSAIAARGHGHDANRPLAVYWDYISVYHDAPGCILSVEQQRLHTQGLAAAASLYAHAEVTVWLQTRLTPASLIHGGDGASGEAAAAEGLAAARQADMAAFLRDGRCRIAYVLASLLTPAHALLDLGRLPNPVLKDAHASAPLLAMSIDAPPAAPGEMRRSPPLTPARLEAECVARSVFSSAADRSTLLDAHSVTATTIAADADTLWLTSLYWGDAEMAFLIEALPLYYLSLRSLNLAGNHLTEASVAALATALPPSVTDLDLSYTGLTDAAADALCRHLPCRLSRLNLDGNEGASTVQEPGGLMSQPSGHTGLSSAARAACTIACLGQPEVNGSGAMQRWSKANERHNLGGDGAPGSPLPRAMSVLPYDHLFVVALVGNTGSGKSCLLHRLVTDAWSNCEPSFGVDMGMRTFLFRGTADVHGKTENSGDGRRDNAQIGTAVECRPCAVRLQVWDAPASDSASPSMIDSIYSGAHAVVCYWPSQLPLLSTCNLLVLPTGRVSIALTCNTRHLSLPQVVVYDSQDSKSFDAVEAWLRAAEHHAPRDVVRMIVAAKQDNVNTSMSDTPSRSQRVVSKEAGKLAQKWKTPHVATSAYDGGGVDEAFALLAEALLHKKQRDDMVASEAYPQRRTQVAAGAQAALSSRNGADNTNRKQIVHHHASAAQRDDVALQTSSSFFSAFCRCCLPATKAPQRTMHPTADRPSSPVRSAAAAVSAAKARARTRSPAHARSGSAGGGGAASRSRRPGHAQHG